MLVSTGSVRPAERHSSSPELVRRMHKYVKAPTPEKYRAMAELAETRDASCRARPCSKWCPATPIRARAKSNPTPSILESLLAQAMSLGALSAEAHRALAIG